MITDAAPSTDFFVAGGTLRTGAQSYVTRPADKELLDATMTGEFCYVLTPRQMGKSSLMVRTARTLQSAGVRTVILDLTSIGTEVTVEQWYLGLISRINSRLDRTFDVTGWWNERAHLSVVQRFTDYLREMLLQTDYRVVIFIDEIDTTLSLDFRDDFFAAIRYFYNMRSDEPGLEKLSITLLGVATPADLIRDRARTPFNIGHRIELNEFSRADARVLEQGLEDIYPGKGVAVFDRIYHWTNGHPYLTQKLCLAASEDAKCTESPDQVDSLVNSLFLSEAARRETNLQFIRDNITAQGADEQRRLLSIYRDVLHDKSVIEDERSLEQGRLKLIGLVKGNNRILRVRNNVYRTVFDEQWIKETIPVDWNRRIAIGALIAVVVMAIGVGFFIWSSRQQTTERFIEEQTALFESGNPSVQLTSLDALYSWGSEDAYAKADELYNSLSQSERLALTDPIISVGLDDSLKYLTIDIFSRAEGTPENEDMMSSLATALLASDSSDNILLGNGLEQWLNGRLRAREGDYQGAIAEYLDAIRLMAIHPGPRLFFDTGVAYTEAGDLDNALAYLERTITETEYDDHSTLITLPVWHERVSAFVIGKPELLGRWAADRAQFPSLRSILPTPTFTPTHTFTPSPAGDPTSTETPVASLTPSRTPAPTDTPTANDGRRLDYPATPGHYYIRIYAATPKPGSAQQYTLQVSYPPAN